ncbi:MAG: ArnT family glycosyltransferase [Candidatus Kapaibacteriales bacterium]
MSDYNYSSAILVFVLSALIILFNISEAEIQPWDEGLYAHRARVIIQKNLFMDQTPLAIGGLYSSSYPPLVPIAISFSIKLFGNTNFSIRFFSALCSILTLTTFFLYFSRKFPLQLVFLFTVNLLISFHWLFYSRQGMTEIPLVCFSFFSILLANHTIESTEQKKRLFFGILTAISFFLTLMTKVVISLVPLTFLLALLINKKKKEFFSTAPFFLIGIFLALPWYLFMAFHYGYEFTSVLIPMHFFQPIENNIQKLSFLYYINQIIVSNPVFVLALIYLVLQFFYPSSTFRKKNILELTMLLWAFLGLIIFSFAATQLQHYTVYLLLPINYLAMDFVYREDTSEIKIKSIAVILILLASLWYFIGDFRQHLSQNLSLPTIILLLCVVAVTILILNSSLISRIANYLKKISLENIVFLLIIIILTVTIISLQTQPTGKIFGGEIISKYLMEHKNEKLVYLYHYYNESDKFNPQISWYTNGKFLSGNERLENAKILRFPLPRKTRIIERLRALKELREYYVLYYIPDKKLPYQIVINELASMRRIIAVTPNYILWGKISKKIEKQNVIFANQDVDDQPNYSLLYPIMKSKNFSIAFAR